MIEWDWDDTAMLANLQDDDVVRGGLPAHTVHRHMPESITVTLLTWQPAPAADSDGWSVALAPDPVAVATSHDWESAMARACSRFRAFYCGTASGGRWAQQMLDCLAVGPLAGDPPVHPAHQVESGGLTLTADPTLAPPDRAATAMHVVSALLADLRGVVEQAADPLALWGSHMPLSMVHKLLGDAEQHLEPTRADPTAALAAICEARGVALIGSTSRPHGLLTSWTTLLRCLDVLRALAGGPALQVRTDPIQHFRESLDSLRADVETGR